MNRRNLLILLTAIRHIDTLLWKRLLLSVSTLRVIYLLIASVLSRKRRLRTSSNRKERSFMVLLVKRSMLMETYTSTLMLSILSDIIQQTFELLIQKGITLTSNLLDPLSGLLSTVLKRINNLQNQGIWKLKSSSKLKKTNER